MSYAAAGVFRNGLPFFITQRCDIRLPGPRRLASRAPGGSCHRAPPARLALPVHVGQGAVGHGTERAPPAPTTGNRGLPSVSELSCTSITSLSWRVTVDPGRGATDGKTPKEIMRIARIPPALAATIKSEVTTMSANAIVAGGGEIEHTPPPPPLGRGRSTQTRPPRR